MARAKKMTAKQIEEAKKAAVASKKAAKVEVKEAAEVKPRVGREKLPVPTFDPKKHYDVEALKEVTRLFREGKNKKDLSLTQKAREILRGLEMRMAEYIEVAPRLGLFRKKVDGKVVSVAEAKFAKVAEETKVMFKKASKVHEAEIVTKGAAKKASSKEVKEKAKKPGRSAVLVTV